MASAPDPNLPFDIQEQIARIDKMQAEIQKLIADTTKAQRESKVVIWQVFATVFGAGMALIAAGAALAKLLIG